MTNLTIWTQSRIKYFEKSSYTESDEQHDTKEYKVQSKNCKYINGTVIANENVLNNSKITFSIN